MEKYKDLPDNVRYYGVAVVKKDADLELKKLKGKKTCHTGAGKTAGWVIPIGYFLSKEIMDQKKNAYESAADFFEACCVPGNNYMKYFICSILPLAKTLSHAWKMLNNARIGSVK